MPQKLRLLPLLAQAREEAASRPSSWFLSVLKGARWEETVWKEGDKGGVLFCRLTEVQLGNINEKQRR